MRKMITLMLLASTLATCAAGAEKRREWKTGKVLDSQSSSYFAGTSSSTTTYGKGTYSEGTETTQQANYAVYQVYTIEVGDLIYVAEQRLRWRWSKPADLTINDPVQLAVEKDKIFILDEKGKEHEARITKRTRKPPAGKPESSREP
ncbi:MAG: hypothetical protein ACE141_15610 [Bryobacteraceae bacterium]